MAAEGVKRLALMGKKVQYHQLTLHVYTEKREKRRAETRTTTEDKRRQLICEDLSRGGLNNYNFIT